MQPEVAVVTVRHDDPAGVAGEGQRSLLNGTIAPRRLTRQAERSLTATSPLQ